MYTQEQLRAAVAIAFKIGYSIGHEATIRVGNPNYPIIRQVQEAEHIIENYIKIDYKHLKDKIPNLTKAKSEKIIKTMKKEATEAAYSLGNIQGILAIATLMTKL